MTGKIQAFVECHIDDCKLTYPLGSMRMLEDKPICFRCLTFRSCPSAREAARVIGRPVKWDDLPPVTLEDLKE